MSARELDDHLLAPPALADALAAVHAGRPVRIVDDLRDGGAIVVAVAGRAPAVDVAAVAMPKWRGAGPRPTPTGATVVHLVPDLGLVVEATLATASVDLLRLAGADPVALHLEAADADVTVTLSALVQLWCERSLAVEHVSQARLPTIHGDFMAHVVRDVQNAEHVLLARGDDLELGPNTVVPECVVAMAMGGLGCGCRARLEDALAGVERAGRGSVLLVRADLFGLAAPGACPEWSTPDPAARLRHHALGDAARACVVDRRRSARGVHQHV